jgi:hypothetical protein
LIHQANLWYWLDLLSPFFIKWFDKLNPEMEIDCVVGQPASELLLG